MAKGIINGTIRFEGDNVVVARNGNIMVNGDLVGRVEDGQRSISIIVEEGTLGRVECTGSVDVRNGNVEGDIDTTGSVTVSGYVGGNVDTTGSVTVGGDLKGSIDTTGAVTVHGSVAGDIETMGSVRIGSK